MKLLTKEYEDSMSLKDIKYLKEIIKTGKDEFPLIHFFNIFKTNKIFSNWNQKTKSIPVKIGLKNQYNIEGITFNGALNIYIKKHSDNKYKVLKGELIKLSQIIQQKNNFIHIKELDNILIEKIINKDISPFDFVIQKEKIKFEGLIYRMYFSLFIIINYLKKNILSREENKKILNYFLKQYKSLIEVIKSYYKIEKLDLNTNLKLLEDILENNKTLLELFTLFIEKQVDKEWFKDRIKEASSI